MVLSRLKSLRLGHNRGRSRTPDGHQRAELDGEAPTSSILSTSPVRGTVHVPSTSSVSPEIVCLIDITGEDVTDIR